MSTATPTPRSPRAHGGPPAQFWALPLPRPGHGTHTVWLPCSDGLQRDRRSVAHTLSHPNHVFQVLGGPRGQRRLSLYLGPQALLSKGPVRGRGLGGEGKVARRFGEQAASPLQIEEQKSLFPNGLAVLTARCTPHVLRGPAVPGLQLPPMKPRAPPPSRLSASVFAPLFLLPLPSSVSLCLSACPTPHTPHFLLFSRGFRVSRAVARGKTQQYVLHEHFWASEGNGQCEKPNNDPSQRCHIYLPNA